MQDSNIKANKWLFFIFIYAKSNGRILPVNSGEKLTQTTSFFIGEKIRLLFKLIPSHLPIENKFLQAVKNIFDLQDLKDTFNRASYKKGYIDPDETIDFTKDYERILIFIKHQIHYHLFRKWICVKFCDAGDVLSELIIDIADSDIKVNITGAFIITMARKKLNKMWSLYIKSEPNLKRWYEQYHSNYKKQLSSQLKKSYIISLLKGKDISMAAIEAKREEIKNKRRKNNSYLTYDEDI